MNFEYPFCKRENSFARQHSNLKYKYDANPSDESKENANCEKFVHWYYSQVLQIQLPQTFRSKEIWEDNINFEKIEPRLAQPGDILLAKGKSTLARTKVLKYPHVAIISAIGENYPEIMHINNSNGVVVLPISLFYNQYPSQLCRIKRLKPEIATKYSRILVNSMK